MSTTAALAVLRGSRGGDASVRERTAATQAGCEILHVLPHGVLVRGDDKQLAEVADNGFRVKVFPDTEFVQAGKFRWRIDEAPPVLEPEWTFPSIWRPPGRTVWYSSVARPSLPGSEDVEDRGAIVIDSVGRYGLLISASATVGEGVAALPWVTLVSLFRPAIGWRRHSSRSRDESVSWRSRSSRKEAGTAVDQLAWSSLVAASSRKSTHGRYASIVAELDAASVKQIAQLRDVRSLSYLNPTVEPSDERSCQILTAQAGPGYPAWLAGCRPDRQGRDDRVRRHGHPRRIHDLAVRGSAWAATRLRSSSRRR